MRIRALALRILRQFIRDKRTLILMFLAPIAILWMMSLVFNGQTYHPHIGVTGLPEPLMNQLIKQEAIVTQYGIDEESLVADALQSRDLDAWISLSRDTLHIKLEGSDPSLNRTTLLLLEKAMKSIIPEQPGGFKPEVSYLHGSVDMVAFDHYGPVLVGYFTFFFVFLIAGVSFLRERTGGTLERLLATPIRRWEIVSGYVLGFGIFTMIQATIIAWFAIHVLGLMMNGAFIYVLLITLLLAMTALSLGTFLSAFANNELQMIQFIPLVIVPQIFFSGLFNIETMVDWLRWLGTIMPLTYGGEALRDIMIRGKGWSDIASHVYVLLAFTIGFLIANVFALKKHRKL